MKTIVLTGLLVMTAALTAAASPTPEGDPRVDPRQLPDDTWISLSGVVETMNPGVIVLDYEGGAISVHLDPEYRTGDTYFLVPGEEIVVNGKLDKGLFQATTIEAASVYYVRKDAYVYINPEYGEHAFAEIVRKDFDVSTVIQGLVTEVRDEGFDVDTGTREIHVDITEMNYDPTEANGAPEVQPGDMVMVAGEVSLDFFEGRELVARSVTLLIEDAGNGSTPDSR